MQDGQIPVVTVVLVIFAIVGFLMFAGMIALFVFLISRAAKRRSYDTARGQLMQQAAARVGFAFVPQAELSAVPFFSNFELFEGSPLKFENLMTGKADGRDASVFDLVYRNVGGRSGGTTTARETIYAVTSRELNLPLFHARPEGVLEKVLNAVSRVDIDFVESPDFSRRFLLYGQDEAAIRRLFTTRVMDTLEQNPGLCVFGGGSHLFFYQPRTQSPPVQVPQNLNFLSYLHDLFRA
jgi:hypothetical protein